MSSVLFKSEAALTPGHALQVGIRQKLTNHMSACHSSGCDFIPVVAESLGGLADDTIQSIRRLSLIGLGLDQPIRIYHHLAIFWPFCHCPLARECHLMASLVPNFCPHPSMALCHLFVG